MSVQNRDQLVANDAITSNESIMVGEKSWSTLRELREHLEDPTLSDAELQSTFDRLWGGKWSNGLPNAVLEGDLFDRLTAEQQQILLEVARRRGYLYAEPFEAALRVGGSAVFRLCFDAALPVETELALVRQGVLLTSRRRHLDMCVRLRPDAVLDAPIDYETGYLNDYGQSEYEYRLSEEYNLLTNVFERIDELFSECHYSTNDVRRFLRNVHVRVAEWLFLGYGGDTRTASERLDWVRQANVKPSELRLYFPLNSVFDMREGVTPEPWFDKCDDIGCELEWALCSTLIDDFAEQMGWM